MLKTPSFKNKNLAITWMLILSASLVAVDYFMSPIIVDKNWEYKIISIEGTEQKQSSEPIYCDGGGGSKQDIYKICLDKNRSLLINNSRYKGYIKLKQWNEKEQRFISSFIVQNLHQAELIELDFSEQVIKEILIYEKEKKHYLLFSNDLN